MRGKGVRPKQKRGRRKKRGLLRRALFCLLRGFFLLSLALLSGYITMQLTLEKGKVEVPDVRGREATTALKSLERLGFSPRIVREEYSDRVPKGAVIRQLPSPGARVREGSEVRLIVSRGSDLVIVPDLLGLDLTEARRLLSEAGLIVGKVAKVHSGKYPKGRVIAQEPPPGTPSRLGRGVNLSLSLGPKAIAFVMPDLLGEPEAEALRALRTLGLEVRVSYEDAEGQKGRVLHQDPPPGVRIKRGASARIIVGR